MAELLLEILSEEIPARMQARAADDLKRLVCDGLKGAGIGFEIIDVRFPPEYKHGHIEGASNVPVVVLRKRLRELDRNRTWLVTPEGGRRSELAVYLLRQAGLNAYLLNG